LIDAYESVLGEIPIPKSLPGRVKEIREALKKNYTHQMNATPVPQPGA
jgi:uncharacterized membrane protein